MLLRIEISRYKGQPVEKRPPIVINEDGGTIGRAVGNTIVLPDESVSRRHARICYENGYYYLVDDSSNGTLISNRDVFIQGEETELINDDILRIGDFELKVNITESEGSEQAVLPSYEPRQESPAHATPSMPVRKEKGFSIDDFFRTDADKVREEYDKIVVPKEPHRTISDEKSDRVKGEYDKIVAPGEPHRTIPYQKSDSIPQERSQGDRLKQLDQLLKGMDEPSVADTLAVSGSGGVDQTEVYEPKAPSQAAPPPSDRGDAAQSPGDKQTPEEIYGELLERFLRGAQVENTGFLKASELPELMEGLGAVFRELVNGLWRVLRGRSELKAEMRLAMTMVRPTGNNPLKLSPGLEDAVRSLLKKGHPSFLEPREAVIEGFDDIMNHELALGAGMQATLAESLGRFDPESFGEKNKDGSILQSKGHLWKAYCKAYPELREAAMEGIFGKAFATAYENQLGKLRSQKKQHEEKAGSS